MQNAPSQLKQNIERLTHFIRSSENDQASPGNATTSRYYREFVRGNIKEVIQHSFPEFCSCADEETVDTLAEGFLKTHKATEPEFHHIATEFVRFAQFHFTGEPALLSLLEYEWVLFSIEIDACRVVNPFQALKLDVILQQDLTLTLNPTLQYLKVPFSLEAPFDGSRLKSLGEFYYVLFRNQHHQILKKFISETDHYFLRKVSEYNGSPISIIQTACTDKNKADFVHWLQHAISTDLIICS